MIANDPYLAIPIAKVTFFLIAYCQLYPHLEVLQIHTKWPRCRDWSTATKCNQMVNRCIVGYKLCANGSGYCPKSICYNAFPDLSPLSLGQQFSNLDITLIWIDLKQFFMKITFYREANKSQSALGTESFHWWALLQAGRPFYGWKYSIFVF